LKCVSQHLNKYSQAVNRDFEDGGDVCVQRLDQNIQNPMDDPDSLRARAEGEQEPADDRTIVRRIAITVEREITTVILRRRNESSGPTLPPKPPAGEDSDNGV
jgi:hypothetical protein